MSSGDNKKTSYFNTLVFTIIAGIVSLCIMGLFFFDIGKEFMVFLIALEVGIFSIIAFTIFKIYKYEKDIQSKGGALTMSFDECPDYYVKRDVGGKDYCFNEYHMQDVDGTNTIVKIQPLSIAGTQVPMNQGTITASDSVDAQDPLYAKFELRKLQNDITIPSSEQKCSLVYSVPRTSQYTATYSHIPDLPWTYARSRCQSFAEN